jgi:hypothetical protein
LPKKIELTPRDFAVAALRDIRRRPLMLLILAASTIPWIFLYNFLAPGAPVSLYFIFLFIGFCICYAITFLFWCMAVYLFDDDVQGKGRYGYGRAYARMLGWARPSLWTGLVYGVISLMAIEVAKIIVIMLLSSFMGNVTEGGSAVVLTIISQNLIFIAADAGLVLIVLAPQMLSLERGRKLDEVIKASYYLVKERYRNAFILIIIPEIVIRTVSIGVFFAIFYLQMAYLVFVLLLITLALLEGARIVFLAAAFNRFYYQALDEEKRKRKKKSRQKATKKKKR